MTAGLLGAMGQGMGLVLAKLGMNVTGNTELAVSGGDVTGRIPLDPLSATLVRVAAGGIGVLAIAARETQNSPLPRVELVDLPFLSL